MNQRVLAPLLLFLLLSALAMASCSASQPPPPALNLAIMAGADQNPSSSGQPSPVAVRLFFLTATAKFERADVFALTEREPATLGEDSAGSEEFLLRPDETRNIQREPKKGVQFLGVAVLFRDIDHSTWRALAPIAASGPTKLLLNIHTIKAELVPAPK
jgi:type VI secretion system protein VasD